jgi:hypothetical protein
VVENDDLSERIRGLYDRGMSLDFGFSVGSSRSGSCSGGGRSGRLDDGWVVGIGLRYGMLGWM